MENINFEVETEQGFKLHGTLHLKNETLCDDIIIFCHGLLNTRNSNIIQSVINRIKFNSISFDFQGNGESEGTTNFGNYVEEVENLRCIISYVRSTLKRKVLCICGHSKGAIVVLMYGSKFNDVPLIINISGRYDHSPNPPYFTSEQIDQLRTTGSIVLCKFGLKKDRDYVVRQEEFDTRKQLDMSCVKNIDKQKVRVLTVHGSKDDICPIEGAHTYHRLIGPEPYHKLIIIPDATHIFNNGEHQKTLAMQIQSWISENLS
ncbi:2832_t:CDS:1 [Diversispora eburnea]|uniref:2832_t:CDS:1 n=1 Tax=Diversispora eburnea TaxID=1213867 RepID=A0A9N9C0Z0_9GLOM|nr:2832_t:CDS:1 [Diversispora eburnea]